MPATIHTFDLTTPGAFAPEDFSLWVRREVLAAGATTSWVPPHGDEVAYIEAGAVEVAGRPLPTGSAVIVESDVPSELQGGPAGATVVHFGPHDAAPPSDGMHGAADRAGHGVHLVGPRGTYAIDEPGRSSRFYADSTCPTCRLTLLFTSRSQRYVSAAHSHSQDEVIYLVDGEVQLGRHRLGPHTGVMIPAGYQYGFTSAASGFAFLNYRRDASVHRVARTGDLTVENGASTGMARVGDLR